MPTIRALALCLAGLLPMPARAAGPPPIFDRHLHYNAEATAAYPVADVLRRFRDPGVATIIATSRPNEGARALVAAAAADPAAAPRMVLFIRPYRTEADRQTWFNDPDIYALIESERVCDVGGAASASSICSGGAPTRRGPGRS